jgi:hypothetical protein
MNTDTHTAARRDALRTIIDRRDRLKLYGRAMHGQTIDVLTLAADEITRLRAQLERCRARHQQPEAIATGRPQRVSGGVAR